jgi:hypothetical protein
LTHKPPGMVHEKFSIPQDLHEAWCKAVASYGLSKRGFPVVKRSWFIRQLIEMFVAERQQELLDEAKANVEEWT